MTAINWTDDLSVGVHVIDADHKTLIDLINEFSRAVDAGDSHEMVGGVLGALYDYTDFHFTREEAMMDACGYDDLAAHRKVHDQLRARVKEIRDLHAAHPNMVFDDDLRSFMTDWLTTHIMGTDMKYAPSMEGKEREIAEAHRRFLMDGSEAPSADATE